MLTSALLQCNIPPLRTTAIPTAVAPRPRDRSSYQPPRRLLPESVHVHLGRTRLLGADTSLLLLPRYHSNLVVLLLHQLHADHSPRIEPCQPRTFDPSLPQATQLRTHLARGTHASQRHPSFRTTARCSATTGNHVLFPGRR